MIERFLRYSLEHGRKIKVVWQAADGAIRHENLTVLSIAGDSLFYLPPGRKKAREMPLAAVLAAAYARGDEGDTLVNLQKEGKP